MNIKKISEAVLAELEQGKSRQDVFLRLSSKNPDETAKIAWCIAGIPGKKVRQKYLRHNAALFGLLILYAGLTLVSELPVKPGEPTLFIAITTIIPLIFSYFVFKFHGSVYRLAWIWFLIDFGETVLLTGAPTAIDAFRLIVLFSILFLGLFLARKVFPNLGVMGPKKDDAGNFLL